MGLASPHSTPLRCRFRMDSPPRTPSRTSEEAFEGGVTC